MIRKGAQMVTIKVIVDYISQIIEVIVKIPAY